jgi:small subunit ribosomal protein S8
MKTNYPVGDFLIKVKNSAVARNKELVVASSKEVIGLAEVLKKLGYFSEVKKEKETLRITLTYRFKRPVLTNLKLRSKPGLRVYMSVKEIEAKKGPSTFVITTPKGILSSRDAIKQRSGGEVIAEIW